MQLTNLALLLLSSVSVLEATAIHHHQPHLHVPSKRQDVDAQGRRGGNGGSPTCLNANVIQTSSAKTGQEPGTEGIKPGQSPSNTDPANFINFCSGSTLTNGKQNNQGSCNPIPMGRIPSVNNMISSIILRPAFGEKVPSDTTFNISVQTRGLTAGSFTNPTVTYYNAPQDLDGNGQIIGHCHVTLQSLGNSLNPSNPPDPAVFSFFKGIDDAGNGQGLLQAVVAGGLPAGFYRVCTMNSASTHQPVNMPIAQRGAQDDCTKFEVVLSGRDDTAGVNGTAPTNTAIQTLISVTSAAPAPTGEGGASEVIKIISGTLGGEAPFVVASGDPRRPFMVNGKTFRNAAAAVERSCLLQFKTCVDAVNRGALPGKSVRDCQRQKQGCGAA